MGLRLSQLLVCIHVEEKLTLEVNSLLIDEYVIEDLPMVVKGDFPHGIH